MTYRKLETLSVELELTANLRPIDDATGTPHTIRHLFEPRDIDAVNASLAAGRPLLVRGEPGAGKSQLARAAAQGLGRAFVSKVIDARTEARDLLWTFDAVRRLADAQVLGAGGAKKETVERELCCHVVSQLHAEVGGSFPARILPRSCHGVPGSPAVTSTLPCIIGCRLHS
jgi:hypothetical protein